MTPEKLYELSKNLDPKEFVKIHQEDFFNYYLRWDDEFEKQFKSIFVFDSDDSDKMNDYYQYIAMDLITEKYFEFFQTMEPNEVFEWLNMDIDPIDLNLYLNNMDCSDDFHDKMDELYYEMCSGHSLRHYMLDLYRATEHPTEQEIEQELEEQH